MFYLGRCLGVVGGTVVEEPQVGYQAALADRLDELPLEEALARLLVEALTAPVAPVLTVLAPATAHLTALAHLTARALAPLLSAQDLGVPPAHFSTQHQ